MVQNMGTGINLGNILSAPYEGNWANALTEDYIDNVARMRFQHVRIPIRFDNQTTPLSSINYTANNGNYIGTPANYSVNEAYLNRIEEIIDWCFARNLIVIIDVHGDHWFWESFDETSVHHKVGNDRLAAIDRFKAIWRDISVRFQSKPDNLLFEIMNEPYFSMNAQEVIDINTQMLSVIRQTNPNRNIIVTGGGQNSYEAPLQLTPVFLSSDNHLITTFHYYQPFNFTSSALEQYTDNQWGTNSDKSIINNHFNQVQSWSQANNVPIYFGEFGADNVNGFDYETNTPGNFGGPDTASRFVYHQYLAQAARSRGFALAVWDAGEKSGKTLYLNSSQNWVKEIRNAVLDSNCENQLFINNSNIECNYDYNWNVEFSTGYEAKLNNSNLSDGYQNSISLQATVLNSMGNQNGVIISNDDFLINSVSSSSYNLSCKAKGVNGAPFKFRIKCVSSGFTSYINSDTYSLSNQYSSFDFPFIIPANTSQITVQILIGESLGDYFFDAFVLQQDVLEIYENSIDQLVIYPNPTSKYINLKSSTTIEKVSIFNALGQLITDYCFENKLVIDISSFTEGMYFLKCRENNRFSIIKFYVKY